MNIAFVTSEFVTEKNKGGQATYIANIATILSEKGHNIYIVTASDCSEDIVWKDKVYVCRVEYTEEFAALKGVPLVYGILNWILRLPSSAAPATQQDRNKVTGTIHSARASLTVVPTSIATGPYWKQAPTTELVS